MDKILHDPLRTLNYGNYGIFLIMGNAGFCPSAEALDRVQPESAIHTVLGAGLRPRLGTESKPGPPNGPLMEP